MRTGQWIGDLPPEPEPEPPREGRWIAKPRKPRFGIVYAAFTLVYLQILLQVPNAIAHLTGSSRAACLAFLILATVPVCVAVRVRLARRENASDRALVDAAFGDQFTAELTIVVNAKRIGADRGVVWFADGLFGFSARAASFVLAAQNIEPYLPEVRSFKLAQDLLPDSIALVHAPSAAFIVVTPVLGHEKAYRERLRRFMSDAETPESERLWPPLEPYREVASLPQGEARS